MGQHWGTVVEAEPEAIRLFRALESVLTGQMQAIAAVVDHEKIVNTELVRLEARISALERTLGTFVAQLEVAAKAHAQGGFALGGDP